MPAKMPTNRVIIEPVHEISNNVVCAFASRLNIL